MAAVSAAAVPTHDNAASSSFAAAEVPAGAAALAVVGGHGGFLACGGGRAFKPIVSGARGARELAFYRAVCAPAPHASAPPPGGAARFLPRFYGECVRRACGARYLALEDLTAAFRRPSVLDVKLGVQSWSEDAPAHKVAQEAAKYPLQQQVGFRLTGMRVWTDGGAYRERGRELRHEVRRDTLHLAFCDFLSADGAGRRVRAELAAAFLERLLPLRAWLAVQDEWRFYGSSLLLLYEGSAEEEAEAEARREPPHVDLRMIDFAHTWPIPPAVGETTTSSGAAVSACSDRRDTGYLLGLDSMVACLVQVLAAAGDAPGAAAFAERAAAERTASGTIVMARAHHFHHRGPTAEEADAAALAALRRGLEEAEAAPAAGP